MDRITCPTCGEINIKLVWEDRCSYSTTKTKEYICNCGCHFEAIFVLNKKNKLTENY
jgi:predicted RNA-binding Zn-ribbon protein involved in translation (DUF1610 family)